MILVIESVDYAPPELYDQLPISVELLRKLRGSRRGGYWLGRLSTPINWFHEGDSLSVTHLVVVPRYQGDEITRECEEIVVGISYVTDQTILDDDQLTSDKREYVAIGTARIEVAA